MQCMSQIEGDVTLQRLRNLVQQCDSLHLLESAIFYADKVVTLSGSADDVHVLAKAYFVDKQYRRALAVLRRYSLLQPESPLKHRYLGALCLAECKEWEEVLDLLGQEAPNENARQRRADVGLTINLSAAASLLKARACTGMQLQARALSWYCSAVVADAYCYEALSTVLKSHSLNNAAEITLLEKLSYHGGDRWLILLHRCMCKKYQDTGRLADSLAELDRPRSSTPQDRDTHTTQSTHPTPSATPLPHAQSPNASTAQPQSVQMNHRGGRGGERQANPLASWFTSTPPSADPSQRDTATNNTNDTSAASGCVPRAAGLFDFATPVSQNQAATLRMSFPSHQPSPHPHTLPQTPMLNAKTHGLQQQSNEHAAHPAGSPTSAARREGTGQDPGSGFSPFTDSFRGPDWNGAGMGSPIHFSGMTSPAHTPHTGPFPFTFDPSAQSGSQIPGGVDSRLGVGPSQATPGPGSETPRFGSRSEMTPRFGSGPETTPGFGSESRTPCFGGFDVDMETGTFTGDAASGRNFGSRGGGDGSSPANLPPMLQPFATPEGAPDVHMSTPSFTPLDPSSRQAGFGGFGGGPGLTESVDSHSTHADQHQHTQQHLQETPPQHQQHTAQHPQQQQQYQQHEPVSGVRGGGLAWAEPGEDRGGGGRLLYGESSPQAVAEGNGQPGAGASASVEEERSGCGLEGNLDVQACRADWLFHQGRYADCYALTSAVLEGDPYALQVVALHSACALGLGLKNVLFSRGHAMVEEYPDSALSWFTIGCYYRCTRQYENARRYFGKATQLDPTLAAAWIGYGHAFAAQDERDQAMAAYRMAARLFPGLHHPLLGMGAQYIAMGNLPLAERVLLSTYDMCPNDPRVTHEMGVVMYKLGHYAAATMWLRHTMELLPGAGKEEAVPQAWEPTLVNLGHALRKQRRYPEAVQLYERALQLCPSEGSTHTALAFTLQLRGKDGDLQAAIQAYHTALALRADDAFAEEMLSVAMMDYGACSI